MTSDLSVFPECSHHQKLDLVCPCEKPEETPFFYCNFVLIAHDQLPQSCPSPFFCPENPVMYATSFCTCVITINISFLSVPFFVDGQLNLQKTAIRCKNRNPFLLT